MKFLDFPINSFSPQRFNLYHFKTTLLLLYILQTPFDGGGFELYQQGISSLLIILFWVLQLVIKEGGDSQINISLPGNYKYFLGFLFISALSIITSVDRSVSLWVYLYWVNHFLFFIAVYNHFIRSRNYILIIKWLILPFAFISAVWGLYQFYFATTMTIGWDTMWDTGRSQAMFEQANSLGGYLSIIITILISFYIKERDRAKIVLLYLFLLLLFASLITTYSRASWVSLLISVILFLSLIGWKNIIRRYIRILSILIGVSFVFFSLSKIPNSGFEKRVSSMVGEDYLPGGIETRLEYWNSSIELAIENPYLGTGVGTFHIMLPTKATRDYLNQIWMAHSDYIQFLSEIGFLGTLLLLIVIGIYVRIGFKLLINLKRSGDTFRGDNVLYIGFFSASTNPLLHSLVDFDLRSSGVFALFSFLSAMIWR